MTKRYMSIWFPFLLTDWWTKRNAQQRDKPIVFVVKDHGRLIITATNSIVQKKNIHQGVAAADAKAIVPGLIVVDEIPGKAEQLLTAIGEWCIRFSPSVATGLPDGLLLDISGCAHLWNGEEKYLQHIGSQLQRHGYQVRIGIADTIGAAWAAARFCNHKIITPNTQQQALSQLSPAALRVEEETLERLRKLGFRTIGSLMQIKRSALRRRVGDKLLKRLDQAMGWEHEHILPLQPIEPYEERLPCLDPIVTRTGIEIALQKLLDVLCQRLQSEELGLRNALVRCYRVDNKIQTLQVNTTSPSNNPKHLFRLFEMKIAEVSPGLGIELFVLTAGRVENVRLNQEAMWNASSSALEKHELNELLDRINIKSGTDAAQRYLPRESYLPERSVVSTQSLTQLSQTTWWNDRPRPTLLLTKPEPIQVTALIPDNPPMLFRYQNQLHKIIKADGPERIEREWWLADGEFRDYYTVEDEQGNRYWLFRCGAYDGEKIPDWFMHGFYA